MNNITTFIQQQQELTKIKSAKIVPLCFGKEFCDRSNVCKGCFAFKDCHDFIRDFGFIKDSKPGQKKKINTDFNGWKESGKENKV